MHDTSVDDPSKNGGVSYGCVMDGAVDESGKEDGCISDVTGIQTALIDDG